MRKARHEWTEGTAIYLQLMDEVIGRILDQTYPEGRMLPSVRQLASDFEVNPLTAAKAYKELARDGLIVAKGARDALLKRERARFLKEEWPSLRERVRRLGIDMRALAESAEDK